MQPLIDGLIFIVDDDASVREALAWLLRSRRLASEHYGSAEAFEQRLAAHMRLARTVLGKRAGKIALRFRHVTHA